MYVAQTVETAGVLQEAITTTRCEVQASNGVPNQAFLFLIIESAVEAKAQDVETKIQTALRFGTFANGILERIQRNNDSPKYADIQGFQVVRDNPDSYACTNGLPCCASRFYSLPK